MPSATSVPPSDIPNDTVFQLRQAFKLALSMALFYWLALWMDWDVPQYGGLAIVIISLGTSGATIEKGMMRFVGTTFGVLVGFILLGIFCQDRWATMFAFALYLTLIGYFMQASRNSYAWYVAAFVPLVVWGDNYLHFESAFYFGAFRYLETTAGILIYTMVDIVFWPRRAGDQLNQQGRQFLSEVRQHFTNCRRQLMGENVSVEESATRTSSSEVLSQVTATLREAFADTPNIRAHRQAWEAWSINAQDLVDALDAWQESIANTVDIELQSLVTRLHDELEILARRLSRITALWEQTLDTDNNSATDDSLLPEIEELSLDHLTCFKLNGLDQAAVLSFVRHLQALDQASRELLRTSRVLAGLDSSRDIRTASQQQGVFHLAGWDSERFVKSLFPPTAFIAAFIFWVAINPPTGPKVPMFAGILSLVILRTPMNPLLLLAVCTVSIFVAVAPVYWIVMPTLSTGVGLISLIFVYSFGFGYLGGRSPALKSGPMLMFVTMSGISNQQTYSFLGTVNGALMIILAGVITAVVYSFSTPMRPSSSRVRSPRQSASAVGA